MVIRNKHALRISKKPPTLHTCTGRMPSLQTAHRNRVRLALEVDEDISGKAHIIDIDRIVLTWFDLQDPGRLSALIEAEVLRALSGSDLRTSTILAKSETRIAGEVARIAVRSLQGENHRV